MPLLTELGSRGGGTSAINMALLTELCPTDHSFSVLKVHSVNLGSPDNYLALPAPLLADGFLLHTRTTGQKALPPIAGPDGVGENIEQLDSINAFVAERGTAGVLRKDRVSLRFATSQFQDAAVRVSSSWDKGRGASRNGNTS